MEDPKVTLVLLLGYLCLGGVGQKTGDDLEAHLD